MYFGKGRQADYSRDARGTDYAGLPQSGMPIERTLPHGAQISATGLVLPDSLSIEQWNEVGTKLCAVDTAMQWAIGDWWAYGHHTYGERKASAAAKKLPYEFGSLMNLGRVARRVTSSFRNEAVSFGHHVAVSALEPEKQKKLLAQAQDRKWSVSKLRDIVSANRGRAELDDMNGLDASDGSPAIGHNFRSFLPEESQVELRNFLKVATRAMLVSFHFDRLDQADDAMVDQLVHTASCAAKAWSDLAASLEEYQRKRAAAGKSRSAKELN